MSPWAQSSSDRSRGLAGYDHSHPTGQSVSRCSYYRFGGVKHAPKNPEPLNETPDGCLDRENLDLVLLSNDTASAERRLERFKPLQPQVTYISPTNLKPWL
ncbi:hypothetical protein RRG08_063551 [Elysia crispata]|uniref:Uncharacterized protein n=1 Tax=Elysia crispata TaxID=231223 RepID=A0AAE0YNL0_9GAST|nr:hypothetical protein RRG08_063551 [Elysia crispata]